MNDDQLLRYSRHILLPEIGVTEKKTHSSSLEEHEAEKVRVHFKGSAEATSASKPTFTPPNR